MEELYFEVNAKKLKDNLSRLENISENIFLEKNDKSLVFSTICEAKVTIIRIIMNGSNIKELKGDDISFCFYSSFLIDILERCGDIDLIIKINGGRIFLSSKQVNQKFNFDIPLVTEESSKIKIPKKDDIEIINIPYYLFKSNMERLSLISEIFTLINSEGGIKLRSQNQVYGSFEVEITCNREFKNNFKKVYPMKNVNSFLEGLNNVGNIKINITENYIKISLSEDGTSYEFITSETI